MRSILLIIFFTSLAFSQNITISGKVISKESGLGISNIAVINADTKTGTYTNQNGEFSFKTPSGLVQLQTKGVGYKEFSSNFIIHRDTSNIEISLEYDFAETDDVVVYADDLATRLMKKVIARRKANLPKLKSYTYELYTKFVIATDTLTAGRTDGISDTTINSILESYSKSYYKFPDNYHNKILKKRQSLNIPPQANFTQLDNRLNAWNNFIKIFNEKIYTPFNVNAIDFYEFKFEGYERDSSRRRLHKISFKRKGLKRKSFHGYMLIDSLSLSPTFVEMLPSDEVQLPFNAKMIYRQNFGMVNEFTMPSQLQIEATTTADVFWVYSPRLDMNIQNKQFDYVINPEIDEEIFELRPVELAEDANEENPKFWDNNEHISLNITEKVAYDQIRKSIKSPDSVRGTNFFTKQIAPISNKLRFINLPPFTGWEDLAKYNKVNGLKLGVGLFGNLTSWLDGKVYSAYGIADNRFFIDGNLNAYLTKTKNHFINLNLYNRTQRTGNPFIIKDRTISFLSILSGNDYGDYFYNRGGEFSLGYRWGQFVYLRKFDFAKPNKIELFARVENHETANVNTDFSILRINPFRANPLAMEGDYRSLGFKLNLNYSRVKKISNSGLYLEAEFSEEAFGSQTSYQRYYGEILTEFRTLPLWKLILRITGGYSQGILPFQRYFSIETSSNLITAPGALRTVLPKEFFGSRYAVVNLEHNFGEILPGLFRIPNIASFGLEFILIGNIACSDFTQFEIDRNLATEHNFNFTRLGGSQFQDQVFTEFGIGLNKLFLFFRFDFMARVSRSEGPQFRITLGKASFN
jgi:hypothetical protein